MEQHLSLMGVAFWSEDVLDLCERTDSIVFFTLERNRLIHSFKYSLFFLIAFTLLDYLLSIN